MDLKSSITFVSSSSISGPKHWQQTHDTIWHNQGTTDWKQTGSKWSTCPWRPEIWETLLGCGIGRLLGSRCGWGIQQFFNQEECLGYPQTVSPRVDAWTYSRARWRRRQCFRRTIMSQKSQSHAGLQPGNNLILWSRSENSSAYHQAHFQKNCFSVF